MTQPDRSGRNTVTWALVAALLVLGVAGTLVVPLYARTAPKLGPFPFFYWYQLAWIPIVAILACAAYLLTRHRTGRHTQDARDTRDTRGAHRTGQERRDESR